MRASSLVVICDTGVGMLFCVPLTGDGEREVDVAATRSSTIVFHSPHSGQRPSHLGDVLPQAVQPQIVLYLAFAIL
jgi:hypothetical protein